MDTGRRLLDERVEAVPENVLHARSPGIGPQFFENADDVRDDEAALLGPPAVEQVERERALLVFRIEIDDIVRPMPWDVVIQNIFDELAVRDRRRSRRGRRRCRPASMFRKSVLLPEPGAAEQSEVPAARVGHDIDRPAFMESIFTAADEHGVEGHEKTELRPVRIIRCKERNASNPVIPSGANAPPGRGDRPSNERVIEENHAHVTTGAFFHGRPIQNHAQLTF